LGGRSSSSKYGSRRSRSSSKICACLDRSQRAQKLISLFLPFCCSREGTTHLSICELRRTEEEIRESFLLHLNSRRSSRSSSASGLPSTNSKSLHEEVKQQEEKDAAVLGFWLGFGCGRPGGGKRGLVRRGKKKNNKNKKKNKSAKSLLVKKLGSSCCAVVLQTCVGGNKGFAIGQEYTESAQRVHRECTQRDNNLVRIIVSIRLLLLLLQL
jgi:hypothetical protein